MKHFNLPQNLLSYLDSVVYEHAVKMDNEERWSQDRDDSDEWMQTARKINHLSTCTYRKQLSGDNPVEVTFTREEWRKIKNLLQAKKKELTQAHPIYTKIYPDQIKRLTATKTFELAKDLRLKIQNDKMLRKSRRTKILSILAEARKRK